MSDIDVKLVIAQSAEFRASLLSMNNDNRRETSYLTAGQWLRLLRQACVATCIDGPAALLLAFDDAAEYDNDNFRWFAERFSRFMYVDRVVVASEHRLKGFARCLYVDLFQTAKDQGLDAVVCEVNIVPPNPVSDAFHSKMGFLEIGRSETKEGSKQVRYLRKSL